MRLHHEGSMIGVQCHWWFVEDILEHLTVHFKFFCGWRFYGKLTFWFNFALWSSFQVEFERVVNGLGGQKSSQGSILIWSNGIQCKNRKKIYQRLTGAKRMYFFWVQNIKVPVGIGHPPTYTSNLVYMCAGGFRGHKSLNRIELSWFVQELL